MYARTAQTEEDIRSFAVEVNALCRIRHENIQLFMGVCLDLPQNSLGIVMRLVTITRLHHASFSQNPMASPFEALPPLILLPSTTLQWS